MGKHIFKIVWNRKGANSLITLEIFISFLVVFAVAALVIQFWINYNRPLGFDYKNLYDVGIDTGHAFFDDPPPEMGATVERLAHELEALDPVEGAAITVFEPYIDGASTRDWGDGQKLKVDTELMRVSRSYLEVMKLDLLAGRWFEPADQHVRWKPVVVSPELARDAFGSADPVGQVVRQNGDDGEDDEEFRVIGMVGTFRRQGEHVDPGNVLFTPIWPDSPVTYSRRRIEVRLAPGTPANFEETMLGRLSAVAPPGWTFDVRSVERQREVYLRNHLAPLVAAGLVAVFLMLMVGLGLMGVLWQNVTQRIRELGLRRAKGATAKNIHRQILAELLTVSTLGIGLAALVLAQLPILGLFHLEADVFVAALAASIVVLYLLTALCGLYPSWMATRIRPAEALHYE